MKMKRRLALPMAGLMICLCACGQTGSEETSSETTIAISTEVVTTAELPTITSTEIPLDTADNESTIVLLERHAETILLETPGGPWDRIRLSESRTIIGTATGDLNSDSKSDLVVTVEYTPEELETYDGGGGERETYVLLADNGGYKVRHMNSGLVKRALEGGTFGD